MKSKIPEIRQTYIENISFRIRGVRYYWFGGFGNVLYSYESDVKVDEIRTIADVPMKVEGMDKTAKGLFTTEYKVKWVPVHKVNIEWIYKFKRYLLGV